jgi:hypothetical protein
MPRSGCSPAAKRCVSRSPSSPAYASTPHSTPRHRPANRTGTADHARKGSGCRRWRHGRTILPPAGRRSRWPIGTAREQERTVEIVSATALWYHAGQSVMVRWVLIRDPHERFATQALLCTDPRVTPEQSIAWFVRRWQMETTFAEVRRHLGVETGVNPISRTGVKVNSRHARSTRLRTRPGAGSPSSNAAASCYTRLR